MFSSDESINNLVDLGKEAKEYANLQKDYFTLDLTEKLTKVISGLVIGFVIVCFALVILFYLSFTLIYFLAPLLGSIAASYATITALLIALAAYVFFKKDELIVKPITKFITEALLSDVKRQDLGDGTAVTLNMIAKQKKTLQSQIDLKQNGLTTQAQGLFHGQQEEMARWDQTASLVGKAVAIYDGLRFGLKVMNRFRGFFKKK